jgi:hypothetical protein
VAALWSVPAIAQVSRLDVSNPAPRVNEEIEIIISLRNENLDALERKENKTPEDVQALRNNKVGYGTLKLSHVLTDTGRVTLGPFKFVLGKKDYETDVLQFTVYPELPKDIYDGLWIRQVDFKGERYLIVEQRISSTAGKPKKAGEEIVIIGGSSSDVPYTELDEMRFQEKGLKILSSNARSESQILNTQDASASVTVNYRIATYRFRKTPGFRSRFKLDKRLFVNYPDKNVITGDVWID